MHDGPNNVLRSIGTFKFSHLLMSVFTWMIASWAPNLPKNPVSFIQYLKCKYLTETTQIFAPNCSHLLFHLNYTYLQSPLNHSPWRFSDKTLFQLSKIFDKVNISGQQKGHSRIPWVSVLMQLQVWQFGRTLYLSIWLHRNCKPPREPNRIRISLTGNLAVKYITNYYLLILGAGLLAAPLLFICWFYQRIPQVCYFLFGKLWFFCSIWELRRFNGS